MRRARKAHEESWLLSYADLITNLLLFFVLLLTAANLSKTKMQQITKNLSGSESPHSLTSIQREIEREIAHRKLQDMVRTNLGEDGLELSLNSGLVFDSGKAAIRPDVETALHGMLQVLVPYAAKYNFAVEGHTDVTPVMLGSPFPSNWELSSARAIIVRQRLEEVGIERGRIRVEGYADTKVLPDTALINRTQEERLALHRRVVVRVY